MFIGSEEFEIKLRHMLDEKYSQDKIISSLMKYCNFFINCNYKEIIHDFTKMYIQIKSKIEKRNVLA